MNKNRIKKTIVAGNLVWETISPCYNRWNTDKQRKAINYLHKGGTSTPGDIEKHRRETRDRTAQLIAANVKPNKWIFCGLTFDDDCLPKTRKEALKYMQNFLKRARQFEKLNRKQMRTRKLEYFWSLEQGTENNRFHIHLLVNIPYWFKDQFMDVWTYGSITKAKRIIDEFGKGSNAYAISEYMLKDQYHKGMPAGNVAVKHSTGLMQPNIYKEYVTAHDHLKLPTNAQYAQGGSYYETARYADGYIYQYERHCYIKPKSTNPGMK